MLPILGYTTNIHLVWPKSGMKRLRGNRGRHSNQVQAQRGERDSSVSLEDSADHDPDLAGWCCERFVQVEAKHVTDGEGFRMVSEFTVNDL
jgi:hypothetical protein